MTTVATAAPEPEDQDGQPEESAPELTPRERALANLKPWPKGTSGNPKGRPRRLLTSKLREWLIKDSDLYEAVRVIEEAEGPGAADRWTLATLSNADLVLAAITGIALNRTGTVLRETQLKALALIWERSEGKVTDKLVVGDDEEENRPLMSVEDFRRAISMPTPPPAPSAPIEPDGVVIDVTATPDESDAPWS